MIITMHAIVARGANKGKKLFPHEHADGAYIVSPTRFECDYVRVADLKDVPEWLAKGYSLRMSNPSEGITAPSLIVSASIQGWR